MSSVAMALLSTVPIPLEFCLWHHCCPNSNQGHAWKRPFQDNGSQCPFRLISHGVPNISISAILLFHHHRTFSSFWRDILWRSVSEQEALLWHEIIQNLLLLFGNASHKVKDANPNKLRPFQRVCSHNFALSLQPDFPTNHRSLECD